MATCEDEEDLIVGSINLDLQKLLNFIVSVGLTMIITGLGSWLGREGDQSCAPSTDDPSAREGLIVLRDQSRLKWFFHAP